MAQSYNHKKIVETEKADITFLQEIHLREQDAISIGTPWVGGSQQNSFAQNKRVLSKYLVICRTSDIKEISLLLNMYRKTSPVLVNMYGPNSNKASFAVQVTI